LVAGLTKRISHDSFEKKTVEDLSMQADCAMASFQHGALESRLTWMSPGHILWAWMPAIHAGMTEEKPCIDLCFSCSVSLGAFFVVN
jgi:hypothetical protein